MSFATVTPQAGGGALRVTGGSITEPALGLWEASIEVDSDEDLTGRVVTLRLGGSFSRVGYVVPGAGGVYRTSGRYRLVGGFGGWRRTIPGQQYQGPLARLETIVTDAARVVGERVLVQVDRTVGPFVRLRGQASGVLRLASAWWIDADGTTVIGQRPKGRISTRVLDERRDLRTVRVEEEEVGGLTPGKTIALDHGDAVVLAAVHSMSGGTVLHVWSPAR